MLQSSKHNTLRRGGGATSACSLGFTLAEVLITLGIIGIVAAMTLPAFTHKYNNLIYTVKLKKTVSMLEQKFRLIMAEEEADELGSTTLFKSIYWDQCEEAHYPSDYGCEKFFKTFLKTFNAKSVKIEKDLFTYQLDGRNDNNSKGHYYFILQDGSAINHYFRFWKEARNRPVLEDNSLENTGSYKVQGYFRLDINGPKKPNKWGRDIFWFDLTSDGRVIPQGSLQYSLFNNHDESKYWKNANSCGPNLRYTNGNGCGARIIENGWNMDY